MAHSISLTAVRYGPGEFGLIRGRLYQESGDRSRCAKVACWLIGALPGTGMLGSSRRSMCESRVVLVICGPLGDQDRPSGPPTFVFTVNREKG